MKRIFPRRAWVAFLVLLCVVVAACAMQAGGGESRLSAAVAVLYKSPPVAAWLEAPDELSYIEAYVSFPPETGNDVIFGIDQEFFDGIGKPLFIKGGDWMGLVGLQRSGKLWVADGTPDTMKGKPSANRTWEIVDLAQELQPNSWYRVRTVIDFRNRHYVSFTINGFNLNRTVDLSAYTLDYPNYLPFERRALGDFVFAMRGKGMVTDPASGAVAYFSNIDSGLVSTDGKNQPIFGADLAASADAIPELDIPFTAWLGDPIPFGSIREGAWYREQKAARVRVLPIPGAKDGERVIKCDATLQPLDYDAWLRK